VADFELGDLPEQLFLDEGFSVFEGEWTSVRQKGGGDQRVSDQVAVLLL